jgi:xylulokinase
MLYLGIDLGTSSIKLSVWEAESRKSLITVQYPDTEATILSPQPGWAEQSPDTWWEYICKAMQRANASGLIKAAQIKGIGISYQMHGLVLVDKMGECIGNSIIWCDSRAVEEGQQIFKRLGKHYCFEHLLNAPGNFTAAKLAWIQKHQPATMQRIKWVMLPGDYISFRMTGEATTTIAALSEGIFWDFQEHQLAVPLFQQFNWNTDWIPPIRPVLSEHGFLTRQAAKDLQLLPGIPITYKAGDQMNNAWSLGVVAPGQVAASAGTSGVIFAVTQERVADPLYRVNTFAHVQHTKENSNLGILMCINGAGILNKWVKQVTGNQMDYERMNQLAASLPPGAEGLFIFPFGNGTERLLGNRKINAEIRNIDFNRHSPAHLFRAAQEGIAFAFRYGLDMLKEVKIEAQLFRAGSTGLFLSKVFQKAFVQLSHAPLELIETSGSEGAAKGAAKGAGHWATEIADESTSNLFQRFDPDEHDKQWEDCYLEWRELFTKSNPIE